jgi:hypothetical protein
MSPDPLAGSVGNPQSLNRYAYVVNNPTNFRDPLGLKITPDPGWFLGGGFGSKCTIDGLDAPCSMATSLVNAGAAAICPNNNCTGLQLMGNTFYQWMLAPFSSVVGSLCQQKQPFQCTPGGATYNFKWGWVAVGTADSSGLSDLLGSFGYAADTKLLQAKVFLGALGRNFVDEFKNGGCVGQFFDEMLPTNLNDTPAFQDAAHDSASMLGVGCNELRRRKGAYLSPALQHGQRPPIAGGGCQRWVRGPWRGPRRNCFLP